MCQEAILLMSLLVHVFMSAMHADVPPKHSTSISSTVSVPLSEMPPWIRRQYDLEGLFGPVASAIWNVVQHNLEWNAIPGKVASSIRTAIQHAPRRQHHLKCMLSLDPSPAPSRMPAKRSDTRYLLQ